MRKSLAAFVSVSFVAFVFAACSGDDNKTDGGGDATTDVVTEKKPLPEASNNDVNTGACSPSATIDTSKVTWVPPNAAAPTACSATQVAGLYNGCYLSTSTSSTCQAFTGNAANATCYKCMVSTFGADTSYGALIQIGGVVYANIAGCIALVTGDTSGTGCGAKNQAVTDCETLACQDNCPSVTDQTTFTEYTNCTTAADKGACDTYVTAECNLQDAGADGSATAYATCENHSSFQDYYNAMAAVFCGDYAVSDAGTDAASDATNDATNDAPDGD